MTLTAFGQNPKREFRGAWLHVIGQTQWLNKTTDQQKKYIEQQIQLLQDAGCNAVIFQVRPCADALYISELEPWSQYLTGKRGKAPSPLYDPMEFAIEEAHKRGMEFHAWLNPYRVTSNAKDILPADHISNKEPHRFMKYNGQVLFNPAYQENRDFICEVIRDIVARYDVDAIHLDDYFYPYPNPKIPLNADAESYKQFGNGMNLGDWRRQNVDLLIEQIYTTIKNEKEWVRFGISPFGIWRNKKSDPRGSDTNGLQNYDSLYADILLWAKNGWIDYLAPQLYWSLDKEVASSRHLAKWWNDNSYGVDIYIGQNAQGTMDTPDPRNKDKNELDSKIKISRQYKDVKGNIWFHGYWVTGNYKGIADSLSLKHYSTISLPPAYGDKNVKPAKVKNLRLVRDKGQIYLKWDKPAPNGRMKATDPVKYMVYQFFPDEDIDTEDAEAIIAMTPYSTVLVEDASEGPTAEGSTFIVTAIDRMNRESEPMKVRY